MTTENQQYLRKSTLIVSDESGNRIDLSELRIVFNVKKSDTLVPNAAVIRIYNLSENTRNRIRTEFTRVTLQAGYESNFGLIFDGNIKQVVYGNENSIDTYVDIAAGDGDDAYNFSIVNKSLAAGSTQNDQIKICVDSMNNSGVNLGFVGDVGDYQLPRGKVLFGMSRDYLTRISETTNSTWSIQDGTVQVVEKTSVLPSTPVLLTSKTGVIGTPQLTNEGLKLRVLLNPVIKVATQIQLDNNEVADAPVDSQNPGAPVNFIPSKNADGVYRVLVASFIGDTFGNDWYCDITCLSVDTSSLFGEQVAAT